MKAKYGPACLNLGYARIRLEQHLRVFITNWIGSYDSLMIKHLSNKLIPLFVTFCGLSGRRSSDLLSRIFCFTEFLSGCQSSDSFAFLPLTGLTFGNSV